MRLLRLKPQGPGSIGTLAWPSTTKIYKAGLVRFGHRNFHREKLRSSKIFPKRHLDPSSRSAIIHPATNQPIKQITIIDSLGKSASHCSTALHAGRCSDCSDPVTYFSGFSKINRGRPDLLLYYVESILLTKRTHYIMHDA